MANQNDVRRIALALPGTRESSERFAFSVENKGKDKGFAWAWNERVDPKKPRVPRADVLAVRVAKSLSVRTHVCPCCGLVLDRDLNAAQNIRRAGQARQAPTWVDTPRVA